MLTEVKFYGVGTCSSETISRKSYYVLLSGLPGLFGEIEG